MFVANRMSKNPLTVTPETRVDDASAIMKRSKVRRLPVVQEGRLVGFLTRQDLATVTPSPATTLSKYEINSLLSKICVKDVMSTNVISIKSDATIEEAALLMAQNKIGALPVVSEVGAVVGVITDTDIFRTFVDIMGLADGKSRITISVDNKVGAIKDISGIFSEEGLNIDSLVTCKKTDGKYEILIRGDFENLDDINRRLTAHGYDVIHSVRIG